MSSTRAAWGGTPPVPENTLKFAVGLLLSTFGLFWSVEGLGFFTAGQESLEWPGEDWAILGILVAWFVLSRLAVAGLRQLPGAKRATAAAPAAAGAAG